MISSNLATKNRFQADFQPALTALRRHCTEREIAMVLGISRPILRRARIDVSTARLAWLVGRILDRPSVKLRIFDLLTLGKYELTPQEQAIMDGENVREIKDFSENHADLASIHKTIDTIGGYQI